MADEQSPYIQNAYNYNYIIVLVLIVIIATYLTCPYFGYAELSKK